MYQYIWDESTGGLLLTTEQSKFSKEPRPVYYRELDILGFNRYWNYDHDDSSPLMWAEANNYIYKGRTVAKTKGGSFYTAPEVIILDEPEPNGAPLHHVEVSNMIRKNQDLLENLVQETIQKIYNTYRDYKQKIDIFYVAFSGGKDSVVALDLVQRALPHDQFIVLFGDTGMEFSDTYNTVRKVQDDCQQKSIDFFTSKSDFIPSESWELFGPPSTVTRWCCSVHKTAPQILFLRNLLQKPDFTGMAFVGVRADESLARSKYEWVSYGEKHKGQYSCNAILDWSSAEVFLYIFANELILNETYKKGNRRAGCLVCPRAAERNDYMNHFCYAKEAEPLVNAIRLSYRESFPNDERLEQFIAVGGWKARKNGRDLSIRLNYKESKNKQDDTIISVSAATNDWREWIKTIGVLINENSPYSINFQSRVLQFELIEQQSGFVATVSEKTARENPYFIKLLKNVFRKASCCVGCRECEADCPYGNMKFDNGKVKISDACRHCSQCHKAEKGCLVYKSLEQPKGGIIMSGKSMSLNSYSHHAPKLDWIQQYFEYQNEFENRHNLGSQMFSFFKRFLRDSRLLDDSGFSETAQTISAIGLSKQQGWGIIYTNLCYAPQVQWFVTRVGFDTMYPKQTLAGMMVDDGAKESWTNDIFSSLVRLSELPLGKIGFGEAIKEKDRAVGIIRCHWDDPIAEVVLYALYKYAEACGYIYQFTLETLMDDTVERDGVSPTRIFGLNRETMVRILNGLTINYPEFISASFTLDLDNITLRPAGSELTSQDVLKLF